MSQWAREHPEAMAEIAAAPLHRQNDLLADAARGITGREATRAHYDGELDKAHKPTTYAGYGVFVNLTGAGMVIKRQDADHARTVAFIDSLDQWDRFVDALKAGVDEVAAVHAIDAADTQVAAVEQFDAEIKADQAFDAEGRR